MTGSDIVDLRIRVGDNDAPALSYNVPAPGQLAGSGWWQAVVPIAPITRPERARIAVRLRLAGGREVARELGSIRLVPDLRPAAAPPPTDTCGAGLVAICLATHNPPVELFRQQVESIKAQTYGNWICLVNDDGSSTESLREVKRALAGDERFRLSVADEREGVYLSFERALREVPADATYVAFADQDDRWYEDKLGTLIAALGEDDVLVHSDARVASAAGELLSPTVWPRGAPPGDTVGALLMANPVLGASCLFRRTILDWALPFPPPVGAPYHDRWIALVASVLGRIAYVDRPLYDYVQHPGSVLGHTATVEPGRRPGESRHAAIRRRYADLRQRGFRPNWRAHVPVLARCVQEAEVLRLRLAGRMSRADRRDVERIGSLPSSSTAQVRLLARHLAQLPRRRPGREGALVRAISWRWVVRVRSRFERRSAAPAGGGSGAARRSSGATRIGITVTRDSEQAGFGDFQVALELGGELRRLGFEVTNLETHGGRWRQGIGSVDVLISLLDGFPLDLVPPGVHTMAWVRNWTERWLERPWFGDYDIVLASSERSKRLIEDHTEREVSLMPLATNPDRFRRTEPDPRLRCELMFAGNRWGVSREIEHALPALAGGLDVKVFGRGWDAVQGMAGLRAGRLEYERLPAAYSSARVVVDDSSPHTAPYAAVNSRVFDALACGTLVVSNDAPGVRALFDEEFPVWDDASTLLAEAERVRRNPEWASRLADRYRAMIIGRHTYRHRAGQVRDALSSRR